MEPLDERLIRFQHPKRLSTVHQPISESRSVPLGKSPRCFGDPKNPSATRRPASLHRVEPVSELPARVQAPKSSFSNHHLTSKLREAVKQASRPHSSSEELFSDPSARSRAPGGTFRRASGLPRASEETLDRSSTRFPAPWNLPTGFRTASGLRRAHQQHIYQPSSPVEPFTERLAHIRPPKRPSAGRRPDSQLRVEYINELQRNIEAPKNLSATHQPESELPETHHHPSSSLQDPEEPITKQSGDSELPKNTTTNARSASGIRRLLLQSVVSLPRTQRVLEQASCSCLKSEDFIKELSTHCRTLKEYVCEF